MRCFSWGSYSGVQAVHFIFIASVAIWSSDTLLNVLVQSLIAIVGKENDVAGARTTSHPHFMESQRRRGFCGIHANPLAAMTGRTIQKEAQN